MRMTSGPGNDVARVGVLDHLNILEKSQKVFIIHYIQLLQL